ncbi:MAG: LapA family protein [Bacteroidetes bacterium]|nr:MAG: LapA family protein [Bacteroidota bacterium]
MRFSLILSIVIAIFAVIFALQNPYVVTIKLGPFETQGSTALVLIITFGVGVLVGVLATLPGRIKARMQVKTLKRQLAERQENASSTGSLSGFTPIDTTR